MKIASRVIENSSLRPYVIAEIGVNHENSLERAFKMIQEIKESGGDAAKFQAYKAEQLASKNSPSYWDTSKETTRSQYELFKKHDYFGREEFEKLHLMCTETGIDFLCTPFDEESVDYLEPLVPAFKIASADITNYPLLKKIAGYKKPVLLSTGASTISEIAYAYDYLKNHSVEEICLMQCVLSYPTEYKNANLIAIQHLQQTFPDSVIGYSDHTRPCHGMLVLIYSYIYGARIIEKHYTFDKSLPGNDHYHAMDKKDLTVFVKGIEMYLETQGHFQKQVSEVENISRLNARRGLVAAVELSEGTVLEPHHIAIKRPCRGLEPKDLSWLLGRKLKIAIEEDEFIKMGDIL